MKFLKECKGEISGDEKAKREERTIVDRDGVRDVTDCRNVWGRNKF